MKTFKEYLLGNKTSYPKYDKITNMGQEDLKRIIKDKNLGNLDILGQTDMTMNKTLKNYIRILNVVVFL